MNILFVGCLYKSSKKEEIFKNYLRVCQKTTELIQKYFPNSTFLLHIDDTINENEMKYFSNDITLVRHKFPTLQKSYKFEMSSSATMRKKNCDQLLKCIRLNTLFTYDDNKYDKCIVIDVHDDFAKTYKLINKYNKIYKQKYIFTQWKSIEYDCPYDNSINIHNHFHFDAGLTIVKQRLPSLDHISFIDFCMGRIFNSSRRLPKGVEEMLIDEYLNNIEILSSNDIKIIKHTCEIENDFYKKNINLIEFDIDINNSYIVNHNPFNKELNDLVKNKDIYVCSQI
jgi:hypothetical protein